MKEKYFESIPFIERREYVKNSCLMYLKLKKTRDRYSILDNKEEMNMQKLNGISIFENILSLMNKDENLILKNDFLKKDYNSLWYLDYWCKSTYYKFKHETINKFLFLLFS